MRGNIAIRGGEGGSRKGMKIHSGGKGRSGRDTLSKADSRISIFNNKYEEEERIAKTLWPAQGTSGDRQK